MQPNIYCQSGLGLVAGGAAVWVREGAMKRSIAVRAVTGIALVAMLGSCGGQPDTARMAEHIPTDGIVAVFGCRPARLAQSSFMRRLEERFNVSMELAGHYRRAAEGLRETVDLDIRQIRYLEMYASKRNPVTFMFIDSPLTLDVLAEKGTFAGGSAWERRRIGDRPVLVATAAEMAFTEEAGGLLMAGGLPALEAAFGGGEKLAGDPSYRRAAALADFGADYCMVSWDPQTFGDTDVAELFGSSISGDNYEPALAEEAERRSAGFGLSIEAADTLKLRTQVDFGDEAFAKQYAAYLQRNRKTLVWYAGILLMRRIGPKHTKSVWSEKALAALYQLLEERTTIGTSGGAVGIEFAFETADVDRLGTL